MEPDVQSAALLGRLTSQTDSPEAQRLSAELELARGLAEVHADRHPDWRGLVADVCTMVDQRFAADPNGVLAESEARLEPIGKCAKAYIVHCVGHAHIDMDWSWPWVETISICHDTFETVDRLMDEFPGFCYSQSQVSIYQAVERYYPELFQKIRRRIGEGRWEVAGGVWVEGDHNLSSGESLCRQSLYAKRWFRDHLGLSYEHVRIDWEGDTFGHAHTVPMILDSCGINRYYHCRTGPEKWLLWWTSPDGSRVLRFFDMQWYGGHATPQIARHMLGYVRETGLQEFMFVYGVGDHGGGPTRRDLSAINDMNSWPIYPTLRFSTTDAFFAAIEPHCGHIPPFDSELNTVFEGCYTSQSKAKLVNRLGENLLTEAESIAVVAASATGFEYPSESLRHAWEGVMFNQFHDMLGGSSEHEAMEEAVARFRESEATASAIITRALRGMASNVNTRSGAPSPAGLPSPDLGYGDGDLSVPGGISSLSLGPGEVRPVVVFNPLPFARSEMIQTKLWDMDWPRNEIVISDSQGRKVRGQVTGRSAYGCHKGLTVLFPAQGVPALGYDTYYLHRSDLPDAADGVRISVGLGDSRILENEHLRVEIDSASGAIRSLMDSDGREFVQEGELLGLLEYSVEEPHGMSSWDIGPTKKLERLTSGATPDTAEVHPFHDGSEGLGMVNRWMEQQIGPNRAAVRTTRTAGSSSVMLEIALSAGSRMVEIDVLAQWREIGGPRSGVPMLRIAFPTSIVGPKATYEIPFGSVSRPCDGREVPALRWADLSGESATGETIGLTLVNNCKYGHSADASNMRLTLIRSSYDPDPVPEIGTHSIRMGLVPHLGYCVPSDAMDAAAAFNQPLKVAGTDLHEGPLPLRNGFAEVLTPGVSLAALKHAEDEDGLILRLYETDGVAKRACVQLPGLLEACASAVQVDTLERPIAVNSAAVDGDEVSVELPSNCMASVLVTGWKKAASASTS